MYILEGDDQAIIGRRPVKVDVAAMDHAGVPLPEGAVLLAAVCGDDAAPGVERRRPSRLTLPRIAERVVVRVLPGEGRDLFAEGTTLDLTVHTDGTREADEDVVVVRDAPVSGLGHRDLVAIDVYDDWRLEVTALALVEDIRLGPLAAAARAAARQQLGAERTAVNSDVLVAIDMSASMASTIADGSVAALIDVIVGLAQVIGAERELRACLLGAEPVVLPRVELVDVAATTLEEVRRTGLGCGFRSTPQGAPADPDCVTFIVTDAVPPDVGALRSAYARGEDRRLVIVDRRGLSPKQRDLRATVVSPPPPGVEAGAHLLQNQGALSTLVASLMGPTQVPVR